MAGAIRAFVALELGADARRRAAALVAELRAAPGGDAVRWVREESLHVTLRFLGPTDPARLPELSRALAEATRATARFRARLAALELFPPRRPRVLALGVEPAAPLAALAAAVERAAQSAGFEAEPRAFRPHLTLGRVRPGRRAAGLPEQRAVTGSVTATGEAWEVVETVIFRSELSPGGARYTPLASIPFGPPGGPDAPGGPHP